MAEYFGWSYGKIEPPARTARFMTVVALVVLGATAFALTSVNPITVTRQALELGRHRRPRGERGRLARRLPAPRPHAGGCGMSSFSAQFDFLDQQLVDADGLPVGRVEDLELELPDDAEGPVVVASLIDGVGAKVELKARFDELPHVAALERWLSRHVVGRIPGAHG